MSSSQWRLVLPQSAKDLKPGEKPPLDEGAFLIIGEYKMGLEINPLNEALQERSRQELRETPENIQQGLDELKLLIKDEPNLSVPIDDDVYLMKFLRPCKFYPDSAFRLLCRYYRFRLKHHPLYSNLLPSVLEDVLSSDAIQFLYGRDKTGCRVLLGRIGRGWQYKLYNLDQLLRTVMMLIEVAMLEPATQVCGARVVFDMDGLTLQHISQFGPRFASRFLEWVQECVPVRLKTVHIVNEPKLFGVLFAIFKPFIYEKLRKRLHFHGKNRETLIEILGQDCLPPELGGREDAPCPPPGRLLAQLMKRYEYEFIKASEMGYKHREAD